jgi:hypothetical protein
MAHQGYNGNLNSGTGTAAKKAEIDRSGNIIGGGNGSGPTKGGQVNRGHGTSAMVIGNDSGKNSAK